MLRIIIAALAAVLLSGGVALATEEPPHTVLEKSGAFELRRYAPQIVAEVTTRGERQRAINAGFDPLAKYIFGGNAPKSKIAMTAPVTQQRSGGEKIAMTAPVTQQAAGDAWVVRFVMPKEYTMATLPRPTDPNVRLIEEPARTVAVIRFSGGASEATIDKQTRALRQEMLARKLEPVGAPTYAFYDPPWTLPFLRRNEVMVAVAGR